MVSSQAFLFKPELLRGLLLSAASPSGLPAGGRDSDSGWTGQRDKASRFQEPDATLEDCRQTLDVG